LIGVAFAEAAKTGVLLTFALTLELLFLGLAVATALRKSGAGKERTLSTIVGIAGLLVVGAIIGAAVLGGLSGRGRVIVLSFGLAALLFLVVEELLVEAHEVPETTASTASFFIGFLGLTVIEMLT
jgi:ZIP family zinc transporter